MKRPNVELKGGPVLRTQVNIILIILVICTIYLSFKESKSRAIADFPRIEFDFDTCNARADGAYIQQDKVVIFEAPGPADYLGLAGNFKKSGLFDYRIAIYCIYGVKGKFESAFSESFRKKFYSTKRENKIRQSFFYYKERKIFFSDFSFQWKKNLDTVENSYLSHILKPEHNVYERRFADGLRYVKIYIQVIPRNNQIREIDMHNTMKSFINSIKVK